MAKTQVKISPRFWSPGAPGDNVLILPAHPERPQHLLALFAAHTPPPLFIRVFIS